jgi:hypothetical protein
MTYPSSTRVYRKRRTTARANPVLSATSLKVSASGGRILEGRSEFRSDVPNALIISRPRARETTKSGESANDTEFLGTLLWLIIKVSRKQGPAAVRLFGIRTHLILTQTRTTTQPNFGGTPGSRQGKHLTPTREDAKRRTRQKLPEVRVSFGSSATHGPSDRARF